MPSFPPLQAKYGRVSNRSMTASGALYKGRDRFSVLGQVARVRPAVSCPPLPLLPPPGPEFRSPDAHAGLGASLQGIHPLPEPAG